MPRDWGDSFWIIMPVGGQQRTGAQMWVGGGPVAWLSTHLYTEINQPGILFIMLLGKTML